MSATDELERANWQDLQRENERLLLVVEAECEFKYKQTAEILDLEQRVTALQSERDALRAQLDAKLYECPECAFTFLASHTDESGGYSCPCCAEAKLTAQLDAMEAEIDAACRAACKHCRENKPDRYSANTWEHNLTGMFWYCEASGIRERRYQRLQGAEPPVSQQG